MIHRPPTTTHTPSPAQYLSVPAASSVLTNDTDPNGDNLTARLVTGPSMGTLNAQPGWLVRVHQFAKKGFQGVTSSTRPATATAARTGHRDHPQQG